MLTRQIRHGEKLGGIISSYATITIWKSKYRISFM